MSANDSLDLINDIEKHLPVDRWTIDGVHVWPLIRLQLYFTLRDAALAQDNKGQIRSARSHQIRHAAGMLQGLPRYLTACLADRRHNASPAPADVIFLGDHVSRVRLQGAWYDRLCDPIVEYLRNLNISSFRMEPYHRYRIPRHSASLYIQPRLDWLLLKNILVSKHRDISACHLDGFEEYVEHIKSHHAKIPPPDMRQIWLRATYMKQMAEYFVGILKQVNPRLAFVVEYYSLIGMAFNLACRTQGIKTVEIPHGNHGDIHVAYSRWNLLPEQGYPELPSFFWCWSEWEAGLIRRWNTSVAAWHQPLIGGNWWLTMWKQHDNGIANHYDTLINTIQERTKASAEILLTYEHNLDNIIPLIQNAPKNWRWWIRVHPTKLEDTGKIRRMIQRQGISNYELDTATDFPLYALLRNVDAHVTECSTVVMEAEIFNVPSIITNRHGTEAFPRQISSGWAVSAYTVEDIISAISRQLATVRPKALAPADKRHLHENAIDQLLAATAHRQAN